jgi:hypothetical protein
MSPTVSALAPSFGGSGVTVNVSVSNVPLMGRHGFPASIPRSQLFYWTSKWQNDEAESREELAAGLGVTFASADEAIRWLLSPGE